MAIRRCKCIFLSFLSLSLPLSFFNLISDHVIPQFFQSVKLLHKLESQNSAAHCLSIQYTGVAIENHKALVIPFFLVFDIAVLCLNE